MAYRINDEKCVKCGACIGACPVEAISFDGNKVVINKDLCISCGTCAAICPQGAPEIDE